MYRAYKEIKIRISAEEIAIKNIDNEIDWLIKSGGPKDAVSQDFTKESNSVTPMKLEEYYKRLGDLVSKRKVYRDMLTSDRLLLEELIHTIEVLTTKFKDLELTVFLRHHIQGIELRQVANMLNYSYRHIKRMNQCVKNKISETEKIEKK